MKPKDILIELDCGKLPSPEDRQILIEYVHNLEHRAIISQNNKVICDDILDEIENRTKRIKDMNR